MCAAAQPRTLGLIKTHRIKQLNEREDAVCSDVGLLKNNLRWMVLSLVVVVGKGVKECSRKKKSVTEKKEEKLRRLCGNKKQLVWWRLRIVDSNDIECASESD